MVETKKRFRNNKEVLNVMTVYQKEGIHIRHVELFVQTDP